MTRTRLAVARTRPGRCPICDTKLVSPLGRMCPRGCAHLVAETAGPDPLLGRRLERGPILVDILGQSRSGRIYEALDATSGRRLAVKILRPTVGDPTQFLAQARQIGDIGHPSIVAPFLTWCEGRLAMVAMEYVEGEPLETLWRRDPLTWIQVFMELLSGLGTAATQGYLHLHLTPGKVRLRTLEDGRYLPRILDFGLDEIPRNRWTVMGALNEERRRFMAPELDQEGGDARADVFSVGALLRWIAEGHGTQTGQKTMPAGLAHVIERATRANPRARYADAWEMRAALENFSRSPALVWTRGHQDAADANTVQVDCEHCLWALHTDGPAFGAATERLVGALAAEGRLGTHDVVEFRQTLSGSSIHLCESPERPPHVALECARCGAIESVQLKAIDALRYCGSCGARLPPTRLEQQVTQATLECRPSVFDPRTGTITLQPEMLTVELAAADTVLPCPPKPTTVWTTDDGPRPAIRVTPTIGTAVPAGYLRWVPEQAAVIKGQAISHLVEVGHRTQLPPPAPTADDTTTYVLRFEGRGQLRELRRVHLRRLPPIHVHVAWNGEVHTAGPHGLLMVPRAAEITIRLILQGAAPPLESATMQLRWGDNAVPVVLTVTAGVDGPSPEQNTTAYIARGVIPGGLPPGLRVGAEVSVLFADALVPFFWSDTWCIAAGDMQSEGEPWLRVTVGQAQPALLHEGLPAHVSTNVDVLGRTRFELSAEGVPEEANIHLRSARTGETLPLVRTTPTDRGQGRWTGQLRVSGRASAGFEVVVEDANLARIYPLTVNVPPTLEFEVAWQHPSGKPIRGTLSPETPIAEIGAWPGATDAVVTVRAHHEPTQLRVRVFRENNQGSAGYLAGEHEVSRDETWESTMPAGAEIHLLVVGEDTPLIAFCLRLKRPLEDGRALRLVGGDAITVESVTAGLVETRALALANGRRDAFSIVEARSEGILWISLEHRADMGGGGIHIQRPAVVPAGSQTQLALRIQFPADAPDSRRPHFATLVLTVLGVSEPLRVPVRVDRLMGVMPLAGPLALDLGSARVAARLHTPQGVQTWYGNIERGLEDAALNQAMRAIAARLGRELRQYAQQVEVVAPTNADAETRAARAAWVSQNFVNAQAHCRLDQATAAALGALAELVQRAPLPNGSTIVTVDLGAASTDIAKVRAARGTDGRWQTWIATRLYSHRAGRTIDQAIANEVLRPMIDALLVDLDETPAEAGWFSRAHSQSSPSATVEPQSGGSNRLPQSWHARARHTNGTRRLSAADAWPEDDAVKESDIALLALAQQAKHALSKSTVITLGSLPEAIHLIDRLVIDSPWGLIPLNLRTRSTIAAIELQRNTVNQVVATTMEPLFQNAAKATAGEPLTAIVGCGLGVRAPGVKELLEKVFVGVPLRIFPRALAVRGAYWFGSNAVTVQWRAEPAELTVDSVEQ